jgi:hypothetical protein
MMGERTGTQEALFYGFSLEGHVPPVHILPSIDRLHLRGPHGATDEFQRAAVAQNLRKLAKLLPIQVAAIA